MRVFVFLVVLTVLEVILAFVLAASAAKAPLLIALAIAKATLVAMYYMHLRFEGRVLRVVAIFPLLLSILLALPPSFDVLARR
jgi:cytochrome c oxidase subunit 4